ncbi:MAG: hypothetical protein R3C59_30825 [Planctomycetaceae bacterium]
MSEDLIPIEDDELLYRSISVRSGHYDNGVLSAQAFHPNSRDETGISVFRAKYRPMEDAVGPSPDGYFVAVLHAGELRARGIRVEPQPDVGGGVIDISHAELPQITRALKRSTEVAELGSVPKPIFRCYREF